MTNYNERLDEIIGLLNARMPQPKTINEAKARVAMCHEAKQAITSLFKEMVADAKPEDDCMDCTGVMQFEQNLLKGLEEK